MDVDNVQRDMLRLLTSVHRAEGSAKPILTGETNLTLTKQALIDKVLENEDGQAYLNVMMLEAPILIRQQLFVGYIEDGQVLFDIPDWDMFIMSVDVFNVSYKPAPEE